MKKKRLLSKWFIIPLILICIGSALIAGFTSAYFTDPETSNDSGLAAWTSSLWAQTLQADFTAGISTNVNTSISPDNVLLSAGGSAGANMILLWAGGAAPSGWTLVSSSGGAFYQRFIRASSSYGMGGAATHTHTVSLVSLGAPSATLSVSGSGTNRAAISHTHGLTASTGAVSNLPNYRQLRVIKYNSGVPTTIPAGAIAIFDTAPPTGWTTYNDQNGYFVRGESTVGTTGGALTDTHSHTTSMSLTAAVGNQAVATATPRSYVATNNHTHAATTAPTDSAGIWPTYIKVIMASADANTTIPAGMIAMFDASPTGNWDILSNSGGPFYNKFIMADSSYVVSPGGTDTHSHVNQVITSTNNSGSGYASTSSPVNTVAANPHNHGVTVSYGAPNTTSLPPFRSVIVAKALYYSTGSFASQVLNTSELNSRWDGLSWDIDVPAGTSATISYRSQNTSFLKTAALPAWTDITVTSPKIDFPASYQYKQWKVTFNSDTSRTLTPTLQEVRLFYYGTGTGMGMMAGDGSGGETLFVETDAPFDLSRSAPLAIQSETEAEPVDEVPAIPSNLLASPDDKTVNLSWTANSEGDLSGYYVFRSENNKQGPYSRISDKIVPLGAYTDTNVVPGVIYYYAVTALDLAGNESSYSLIAEGALIDLPPDAPGNLTGQLNKTEAILGWEQNPEPDVVAYHIYRSSRGGGFTLLSATINKNNAFVDSTIKAGVTYYYVVTALDAAGNESGYSNEAEIIVPPLKTK